MEIGISCFAGEKEYGSVDVIEKERSWEQGITKESGGQKILKKGVEKKNQRNIVKERKQSYILTG